MAGSNAMLCIWWDQAVVVHYERLKLGETIDAMSRVFCNTSISKVYSTRLYASELHFWQMQNDDPQLSTGLGL